MAIIYPFSPFKTLAPSLHGGDALNKAIAQGSVNSQDQITALAGGGQTGAAQLYPGMNRATTVASANDSVMLPPSAPGNVVIFENGGAQSCQVFSSLTSSLQNGNLDTINGTAGATGVAVANGKMAIFCCFAPGIWVGPVALA